MKIFRKISLMFLMMLLFSGPPVFAEFIDFTQSQFNPGIDSVSHTVNDVLLDIDVTFTALGASGTNPTLTWDTIDGYGVTSGGGYEYDEVEIPEALRVDFSKPLTVNSFAITDFFVETRWWNTYAETGLYSLDNGDTYNQFFATAAGGNGEFILPINATIDSILFSARGKINCKENHELSLAGMNANPVPEPTTLLLLGSGLVGLAGFGRKRLKK